MPSLRSWVLPLAIATLTALTACSSAPGVPGVPGNAGLIIVSYFYPATTCPF